MKQAERVDLRHNRTILCQYASMAVTRCYGKEFFTGALLQKQQHSCGHAIVFLVVLQVLSPRSVARKGWRTRFSEQTNRSVNVMPSIGVVIIGRNEGERFRRCLASITGKGHDIIYVDSGSSDGSVAWAQHNGVTVVDLDMALPFTAARARNEGFARLRQSSPNIEFVQFLDGDCELCDGWFKVAEGYLTRHAQCGVVAGRTVEKYPEKSIYNLLCDLEWRTPVGIVESCGGIFMVRKEFFEAVEGFNQALIAGEEPELCYRLRKLGWEIHRLSHPMVFHDAAMTRFLQWWKRAKRGGYSYAQGYALHGDIRGGYYLKDSLRIWLWGIVVPGAIIFSLLLFGQWGLALMVVYPIQVIRIARNVNERFNHWPHSLIYAVFNLLGKWPQLCGQVRFMVRSLFDKPSKIIEYK